MTDRFSSAIERARECLEERERCFFQQLGRSSTEIDKAREGLKSREFNHFYKRQRYQIKKEFPEFEKILGVIFDLKEFAKTNEIVNHPSEFLKEEEVKNKDINEIEKICAWQQKTTEILIDFGWNKELQDRFWREAGKFFDIFSQHRNDFEGVRQGVNGQVRSFLILQELGYNPRLASPEEDVGGIDFYISSKEQDEELIAQIKAKKNINQTSVDLVEFRIPSIEIEHSDGSMTRFQERKMAEISKLKATCAEFLRTKGRKIRSVLITLSEDDFDRRSGKPKKGLLDRIKADLEEKLRK